MAMELERQREVGERIKTLRGPKPKRVIAEQVPVTERAYHSWEAAESGISWEHLQRLAEIFGVSENYLLYGVEQPIGPESQLDRIEIALGTLAEQLGDLLDREKHKSLTVGDGIERRKEPRDP